MAHLFWKPSSSVRLNLGSSVLVLKKDLQYKSTAHVRRIVLDDECNLTRAELDLFGKGAWIWLKDRFHTKRWQIHARKHVNIQVASF